MSDPNFTREGTNPYSLGNSGSFSAPVFVDIDGDGDLDAFVGNNMGYLNFYRNVGTATAPSFTSEGQPVFGLNSASSYAKPAFHDIDGDGDLDAFVGDSAGNVVYYQNVGTATAPSFQLMGSNMLGLAKVASFASPTFADLDGDGDLDAVIGDLAGNTYYFVNQGTATAPAFVPAGQNQLGMTLTNSYASPTFVDIDGDGDLDAFVGGKFSTLFYRNVGTSTAPEFEAQSASALGLTGMALFQNPVFVDIDGDSDLDALFGMQDGNLTFFRNGPPPPVAPVLTGLDTANTRSIALDQTLRLDWAGTVQVTDEGGPISGTLNVSVSDGAGGYDLLEIDTSAGTGITMTLENIMLNGDMATIYRIAVDGVEIGTMPMGPPVQLSIDLVDASPEHVTRVLQHVSFTAEDVMSLGTLGARAITIEIVEDGVSTPVSATLHVVVSQPPSLAQDSALSSIAQGTLDPAGTSVLALAQASGYADNDGDALAGVAVTANAGTPDQGTWQYSTDSGAHWFDVGTVSSEQALMLSQSTLVRFVPATDFAGTPGALSVRAVDDSDTLLAYTSGAAAEYLDLTTGSVPASLGQNIVAWTIEISAPQAAPTLTAQALDPTFTEDGSAVALFIGVTASTEDSGQTFTSATLTIANLSDGAAEVLNVGGTDIQLTNGAAGSLTGGGSYTVSLAGGTATLALTGLALDDAAMGALVQNISYGNTSQAPTAGARQITLTEVEDSGGQTATPGLAASVTVQAVNDAPMFSAHPGPDSLEAVADYTLGGAPVILDTSVQVFDAELAAQGHYEGASVTLVRTTGADASDVFGGSGDLVLEDHAVALDDLVIGTFEQTGGTLTITFNDLATQARVEQTLSLLTYANTSTNPPAEVYINWFFNDGNQDGQQGSGGALQVMGTTGVFIDVPPPDLPPVLSATPQNTGHFVSPTGVPLTDLFEGVTASTENDGQTFTGFTLKVYNVAASGEHLVIGYTQVPLVNGEQGPLMTGGSYAVTVTDGVASVSIQELDLDGVGFASLIDTIGYASTNPGSGFPSVTQARPIVLESITDSGATSNTTLVNQVATVSLAEGLAPFAWFTATPEQASYEFIPGTPTTVSFDISASQAVSMIGSTLTFDIQLPPGWTAVPVDNVPVSGIVAIGPVRTITFEVIATGADTAGTFPVTLSAAMDGIMASSVAAKLQSTMVTIHAPEPTHAPIVTGTGLTDAEFTEDGSAAALFVSVTASTEDSGETFTGATLVVTQLADGEAEVLHVDGTPIALVDGASGPVAGGGTYTISLTGTTATVTLAGLALDDSAMSALLENVTYSNTSQAPTAGARQVTLTQIEDSGGQTAAPGLAATVTVEAVNDAPTFASTTGGVAWLPVTNQGDLAMAVAVQSDGKVLLAGYSDNQFSVARMNADGTLDATFGDNGKAVLGSVSSLAQAYALEITADGKILLAGSDYNSSDMLVVRLTSDGELDPTFGVGGKALAGTANYDEYGYAMLVQPDGKIVVAGYTSGQYNNMLTAVRLEADGGVDTGFGTAGVANITQVSGLLGGKGIAMDAEGNILVAGARQLYPSNDFVVARFKPDGTQDTAWRTWSTADVDLAGGNDEAKSVLVLPDGKILLAGTARSADYSTTSAAVVRLNADGTLDTSFGELGKTLVDIGSSGDIHNMIRQPDGKIVLVGHAPGDSGQDAVLIRLDADGALDATFGDGGVAVLDSGGSDLARDVALLPDGKFVVAGYGSSPGNFYNDYLVMRLNADGSPDLGFNPQPGPSSLDGVAEYTLGGAPVALDSSVQIFDAELAAQGHYDGAMLILERCPDASPDDAFGASGNLSFVGDLNLGAQLWLGGVEIGTVFQINGQLTLSFNTDATQARVNEALSSLTYQYVGTQPPASVTISWLFTDDNIVGGPQGSGGVGFATGTTQINLVIPNAAPTDIALSSSTVAENTDTGTELLVGSLSATDPNDGDTHTYSIQPGGDAEAFVIVGNELRLVAGTHLDYETKPSYQVTVRATDGEGAFYDKLMTIEVTNVNEAPSFSAPQGGMQSIDIPGASSIALASAQQIDGKLIVVGWAGMPAGAGDVLVSRLNLDGSLDTSFATAGVARLPVALFGSEGNSVAIQPNGDILVSGSAGLSSEGFFTIRLKPDGSQDPSFGAGGTLWTHAGSGVYSNTATLLQPDGSFIVTGYSPATSLNQLVAVRYQADGTLDTSFGVAGKFTFAQSVVMRDATLDANGNILMAGYVNESGSWKYVVFRVDGDGHLDTDFGNDGRVVVGMSGAAEGYGVLAQADGKVVVTGYHWASGGYAFDVIRLTASGERDADFGVDGIVTLDFGPGNDLGYSVVQQGDKLLVAGSAGGALVVARLMEDGSLDSTFGEGGKTTVATDGGNSEARSILLQADGKIAVVGYHQPDAMGNDVFIVRLNADGSLDQTFHEQSLNTLDGVAQYALGLAPAVLDSDVQIHDPELAAQDSYEGASVTLAREGGADASDVFGGSGGLTLEQDGVVILGGNVIGSYVQSEGSLTITFGAYATQALVNQALSLLTYTNTSFNPPASVSIAWTFNDGNQDEHQGSGSALQAMGVTTVNITIPNETPTDVTLSNASVAENSDTTAGLPIGTLGTTDADTGDTHTYSIQPGLDAAAFVIVGNQLQFAAGTVLDYEAKPSYQVTVRTTDPRGATYDKLLTIALTDVNEQPVATQPIGPQQADAGSLFSFTIPAGTFTDPDAGDVLTYAATLDDGSELPAWLDFDAATGTFSGTPGAADADNLQLKITATDSQGLSAETYFALSVATIPTVQSIVREEGAASATNADTVEFRITFSEPVGNVDAGDFTLGLTGTASGTVTGVTRMHYDHAQYVITVSNVAGDGELWLQLNTTGTDIVAESSGRPVTPDHDAGEKYVIDNTLPAAPQVTMPPGGAPTDDNQIPVQVEPGASWEYSFDGGLTWNPGSGSALTLPDGYYGSGTIWLRQTDAAGNTGPHVVNTEALGIDTIAPPLPLIDSPALTKDATPVISGIAEPGSTITLQVGGATYTTVAADGTWQIDLGTATPDQGSLALDANGSNPVSVTATDPAGNISQANGQVLLIDTTVPDAPSGITLPLAGHTNVNTVTVGADALEPGANWQYSLNFGLTWIDGTGDSFELPDNGYPAGSIQVRQIDAAGNIGAAFLSSGSFTVDTVPPASPVLTSPTLTNTELPVLTGTVEGMAFVTTVIVTIGGATYQVGVNGADWSLDLATATPTSGTLSLNPNGDNPFTLTARDLAGNLSTEASATLVIDTTAPDAPTGVDLPELQLTNQPRVDIDPDGLEDGATWQYSLDGGQNWIDGTGDHFTLPDGSYPAGSIQVRQVDAAGNSGTPVSTVTEVTVDTAAPSAPTVDSNALTNSTAPTLSGTAEPGSTVTVVVGGATYTTVAADGTWQIDLATATPAEGALALNENGANTVSVTATDPAGNVSSAGTQTLVVDTTAPDAPTGVVLPTLEHTNVAEVGIDLDALEDGATWQYSLDGGQNWIDGTGESFILPDGSYPAGAIQVRQIDAAGNPGAPVSTSSDVTVDTVAPTEPTLGSSALTNSTTPVLSGTAEPGSTVTVVVGGAIYTTVATDGSWQIDLATAVPAEGTLALNANGNNTVSVTATDPAGNVSQAGTQTLVVDTTAPDAPTGVVLPTLEHTNISEVTVDLDALEDGATWQYSLDGGQNWVDGTGDSFTLPDDSYPADSIQVRQVDAAGNPGAPASTSTNVTVDTVAPVAPTVGNSALTNSTTPMLSGTAEPGSTVTVVVGGATYTTVAADGSWQVDLATATPVDGSLALDANGSNPVSVTATDPAGNVSQAGTQTLVVDTTVPDAPTGIALPLAGHTNVNTVTVGADALEPGASWQYSLNFGLTWIDGTGDSFELPDNGYPAGSIQVRQIDAAGNIGAAFLSSGSFTVDTVPPASPVLTSPTLTNTELPVLAGTVEGMAFVTTVIVTIGGATYQVGVNGADWSLDLATATPTSGTLSLNPNGDNPFTLEARDLAGNLSTEASATLVIDTAAPEAPTGVGLPGLALTNQPRVDIDPDGLEDGATWQYSLDGGQNWVDGTGDHFTLPDGSYPAGSIQMRQVDAAGNPGVPAATSTEVTVDTVAPAAPTVDSSALTNSTTPILSGTAEPGSTVTVTVGGATYTTVATDGTWQIDLATATPTEGTLALDANGTNAISLTATDPAGNVSNAGSQTLVVDTTAPDAPTGIALPTLAHTNETDVAIDLGALENGASWQYSLDGGQNWVDGTGDHFTLPDGSYPAGSIQVRQVDAAGNFGTPVSTSTDVTVDTVAPTEPTLGSSALTNSTTPVLSGTAEPGSTVTVVVGGATYTTVATDGTWQIDLATAVPAEGTLALDANGGNTVSVTATDPAGNVSSAGTQTLVVDTTAPEAPTGIALPTQAQTNVNQITIDLDALEDGATWQYSVDGGNTWHDGEDDHFTLTDGSYAAGDIQVRQVDAAGNPGAAAATTAAVVIDTVAPDAPAITSGSLSSAARPTISGTAEAGSTVEVTIGGAVYRTTATDGTWRINLGNATPDEGSLSLNLNGRNPISVTVTDPAGNVSLAGTQELTLDTSAPAAPELSFIATASGWTVAVSGLESGASWQYKFGLGDWVDGEGASFTLPLQSHGAGTVLVRQTDVAGNVGAPAANTAALVPPVTGGNDVDGDGLDDDIENGVPGMEGGVQGDGNGDGIPDVEQADVSSLVWRQSPDAQVRYVTLTNDAGLRQEAVGTTSIETGALPDGLALPLGALAFTVRDLPADGIVNFSVYVDADVPINGYFKQVDGQWFDIATSITEAGGKIRIDFSIEDGGMFDADGQRNGVIVDPGAPGWFDGNPRDLDGDQVPDLIEIDLGLTPGVKDNDVFARDDLFVMQLYRDVLGREADTGGLVYWQDQLADGTLARAGLVQSMLGSDEALALDALARLTLGLEDRAPGEDELAAWRAGTAEERSVADMADEYVLAHYGNVSDAALIEGLYADLLGRPADEQGRDYWLGQREQGSTAGDIALQFAHSAEFDGLHGEAAQVAGLYAGLLGRAADAGGLAYWSAELAGGETLDTVIAQITGSAEYHDRFLPGTGEDIG